MSKFLKSFETYFHATTDAPEEFGHAAGLACLSTICLDQRYIKRGTGIRPNLYILLVAGSSRDRKSTAVRLAVDLLLNVTGMEDRIAPEDFTAEALVSYMRKKKSGKPHSQLLIPMQEFGRYLAAASSYGATSSATLCQLYDGESFGKIRAGKKPVWVEKPRVSLFGACAYGMLERHADPKDWTTGLFARFLFVAGLTKREKYATPPEHPKHLEDHAKAALYDLAKEVASTRGAIEIGKEAEQIYRQFADSFGKESTDLSIQAQRERLAMMALKLSILYQVDINPCAEISVQAMEASCAFARKSWASFLRLYTATAGDDFTRLQTRMWKAATEAGKQGIARSDLLRKFRLDAARFQGVLDNLTRNGVLSVVELPSKAGTGGRPKEVITALVPFTEEEPGQVVNDAEA